MKTPNELIKLKSRILEVTGIDIATKSRKQEVVYAKKIYYSIARKKGFTFEAIGSFINADHATALWHYRDTEYLLKQDKHFLKNYLIVEGKSAEEARDRDFFEMTIGMYDNIEK